jgi:hypothetical protein
MLEIKEMPGTDWRILEETTQDGYAVAGECIAAYSPELSSASANGETVLWRGRLWTVPGFMVRKEDGNPVVDLFLEGVA